MAYFKYEGRSIYYEEHGQGQPVLFLHGNTASSKMFQYLVPFYQESFRCILMDFLGNGRSDRVERFSADLWQEESLQVIGLVEHLNCGKVSLVGTSGGAWAGINAALKRPDLIHKVVADSFDGRTLQDHFAANVVAERTGAKADPGARRFYEWCQGPDWEQVVDLDTEALVRCALENRPLFCGELSELKVPVLLMGSREDEMCRRGLLEEYEEMAKRIPDAVIHMFERGGHPAIGTNGERAAQVIRDFIGKGV